MNVQAVFGRVQAHQSRAAFAGQGTEQNQLGQGFLDVLLNNAIHGPGPHVLIVALPGQPQSRVFVHVQRNALLIQLPLQLGEELVHHGENNVFAQGLKLHDVIEAVAKLGGEQTIDGFQAIAAVVLGRKADRAATDTLGAGVGGHHQDNVAEIGLAAVVVGQRAVVHHL